MNLFSIIGEFIKTHILSKITSKVVIIFITGICVVFMSFQYFGREDALSPVSIAGAVIVPFQNGINSVGNYLFVKRTEQLEKEAANERIAALESENENLRKENEVGKNIEAENAKLRRLLSAKEKLHFYTMEEADVIGSDGTNIFNRFTINKGKDSGFSVGMNVINEDGLIGSISYVGYNYSIVTSIIEDSVSVSAMTKNEKHLCIVSGDLKNHGRSTVLFSNADPENDFSADMALVTSDISDKYLPNLLIGYIQNTEETDGGLKLKGTVRTAVDFSHLTNVLVITSEKEKLEEEEK